MENGIVSAKRVGVPNPCRKHPEKLEGDGLIVLAYDGTRKPLHPVGDSPQEGVLFIRLQGLVEKLVRQRVRPVVGQVTMV